LHAYTGLGIVIATVIAVTRLIAYAINDRDRFRRFMFLVFLALAAVAVWWVLADGGVHVVLHDFGTAIAPGQIAPSR